MDKKIVKIAAIVAGVFIFLIIILFVIAACSKKKFDFYKLQDQMVGAAKSYYQSKRDELPREDGDTRTISLKKLISDGFIEEPSKTYKDDTLSCDGSVTVSNNNGFYLYSPSLTCGKDHRTQLLIDKMLETSLVEVANGLYEDGNQYIYKGTLDNNFVKFAGTDKLFRIMRVNEDGTYRLFEHEGQQAIQWDDRYNLEKNINVGINTYFDENKQEAKIKKFMKKYYDELPEQIKAYIVTQTLCIGPRSESDITKDGSTECSIQAANQQLGLINIYEFLQVSLDANCKYTNASSCTNYNWLADYSNSFWTVNGDTKSSSKVWKIYNGSVGSVDANQQLRTHAVFNISDKVTYVTGDGTIGNPYVIR